MRIGESLALLESERRGILEGHGFIEHRGRGIEKVGVEGVQDILFVQPLAVELLAAILPVRESPLVPHDGGIEAGVPAEAVLAVLHGGAHLVEQELAPGDDAVGVSDTHPVGHDAAPLALDVGIEPVPQPLDDVLRSEDGRQSYSIIVGRVGQAPRCRGDVIGIEVQGHLVAEIVEHDAFEKGRTGPPARMRIHGALESRCQKVVPDEADVAIRIALDRGSDLELGADPAVGGLGGFAVLQDEVAVPGLHGLGENVVVVVVLDGIRAVQPLSDQREDLRHGGRIFRPGLGDLVDDEVGAEVEAGVGLVVVHRPALLRAALSPEAASVELAVLPRIEGGGEPFLVVLPVEAILLDDAAESVSRIEGIETAGEDGHAVAEGRRQGEAVDYLEGLPFRVVADARHVDRIQGQAAGQSGLRIVHPAIGIERDRQVALAVGGDLVGVPARKASGDLPARLRVIPPGPALAVDGDGDHEIEGVRVAVERFNGTGEEDPFLNGIGAQVNIVRSDDAVEDGLVPSAAGKGSLDLLEHRRILEEPDSIDQVPFLGILGIEVGAQADAGIDGPFGADQCSTDGLPFHRLVHEGRREAVPPHRIAVRVEPRDADAVHVESFSGIVHVALRLHVAGIRGEIPAESLVGALDAIPRAARDGNHLVCGRQEAPLLHAAGSVVHLDEKAADPLIGGGIHGDPVDLAAAGVVMIDPVVVDVLEPLFEESVSRNVGVGEVADEDAAGLGAYRKTALIDRHAGHGSVAVGGDLDLSAGQILGIRRR